MSTFLGYKAGIATKDEPAEYRFIDLSKETLLAAGVEYHMIPFNPLAALGHAMNDFTKDEMDSWLRNKLVVNIYNIEKNRIDTAYDCDWANYELNMEILAG